MDAGSESLPSGEVTFVFTDIEGSTRMLRAHGRDYEMILQRHRKILREQWSRNDGHELGTEGDSFLVAFADASRALRACEAGQRALEAEPWLGNAQLRVRMGLHSGLAHPRNGEYVALAIHQAARVASAAHGGQVLLSEEVASQLSSGLRSTITTLGRFRVRDFDRSVQIAALDLPIESAHRPPRLVPAEGHNLVRPTRALFGRDKDIAAVRGLLRAGELVSILGPGGVGKTRLAIDVGLAAADDWPGGVWMADLASVTDPAHLPSAIAEALGAPDAGAGDVWASIGSHLAGTQALLILDNCEHLYPHCAETVELIATGSSGVGVLATSRESLGRLGEIQYRLGPLKVSAISDALSPAAELFVDRSGRSATDEVEVVNALCAFLDGLPLAIELAAGRAANMSPAEVLSAVAARPSSIISRDPSLPERHRSLTRVLDWSYQLLEPQESDLLVRLSAFASSFDVQLAEVVAAPGTGSVVPDLLWSLADKSLVRVERAAGASRYRLLNTVRSYAASKSETIGEVQSQLLEHYVETIGPNKALNVEWAGQVGVELEKLRALVLGSAACYARLRQELAWSIGRYHDITDRFSAGIVEVERMLDVLRDPTPERVALLTLLADLYLRLDQPDAPTGETPLDNARAQVDRAHKLALSVGSVTWDDAGVYRTLGAIAIREGDPAEAELIAREALTSDLSERGRARMFGLLGVAAGHLGDIDRSVDALTQELILWESLGLDSFTANTHGNLAEALLASDPGRAATHQLASLDLALALGQRLSVAFSMVVSAHIAAAGGQWAESLRLQGGADGWLEELQFALYPPDQHARQDLLDRASASTSDVEVARLLSYGRETPRTELTELARSVLENAT